MRTSNVLCARCGSPVQEGGCPSCPDCGVAWTELRSPGDRVAEWALVLALALLAVLALHPTL